MHAVMRYTVKADQLQSHLDLLRDVYDDLANMSCVKNLARCRGWIG